MRQDAVGVVVHRLVRACRWRARRLRLAFSIVWRKSDHHPSAARLSWKDAWDIADMVHNPNHLWVCA
ncbi:MAG: hypothetical protein QE274_00230 [Verrucomicrobiaceae bacterium]|nr:hypothetical protein [Verrucomicrobiaceae bacterium]